MPKKNNEFTPSKYAQQLKGWYPQFWNEARVSLALARGKITQNEFEWIIGSE